MSLMSGLRPGIGVTLMGTGVSSKLLSVCLVDYCLHEVGATRLPTQSPRCHLVHFSHSSTSTPGASMTDQPRTAIVTGSARGIGAAVAKRLSRDGFAVAILDLDEGSCKVVVDEITSSGGSALPVGVDVSDEESVAHAVTNVAEALGAPTV